MATTQNNKKRISVNAAYRQHRVCANLSPGKIEQHPYLMMRRCRLLGQCINQIFTPVYSKADSYRMRQLYTDAGALLHPLLRSLRERRSVRSKGDRRTTLGSAARAQHPLIQEETLPAETNCVSPREKTRHKREDWRQELFH